MIERYVKFYRKQNLNIIPIKWKEKAPVLDWKRFQAWKITDEEISQWFLGGFGVNLGIVCGHISENLVVVDFDEKKMAEKVFGAGISKQTFVVKTSKGKHVYFKTAYPVRSFKIVELGIDVKGEGGYVLAPPSIHPDGTEYHEERLTPIKRFHGDFNEELLRLILQSDKRFDADKHRKQVDINTLLKGVKKGERNEASIRVATWYRKAGLTVEETRGKMEAWNKNNTPPLEPRELQVVVESAYRPDEPYGYIFAKKEISETIFTPEILEKANKVLKKGDTFLTIKKVAALLHAGDENIILIEWISALSSSLTEVKINTWQIGKSQKGKSHSKYTVLQLLPREFYEVFTSASPVSLFYYVKQHGEWSLDKKLLYLDEVEASSRAEPMLRSLTGQTDILPRHLSVHEAELLDLCIRGKRAVWFTSVQTFGTEQIKNRFIHLNPDESTEQDDRVFELQDKRYRLGVEVPEEPLRVSQALSKIIVGETEKVAVKIPFEIDWVYKDRRWLYPVFLAFIQVITKIRFKQRQIDKTGALIATREDFALAKRLWKRFLKNIIYRVSESALTVFEILPDNPEDALTHVEISQMVPMSTRHIQRLCEEMVDEGLINARKRTREGKGGRSSWEYWKAKVPDINEMKIKSSFGHFDTEKRYKKIVAEKNFPLENHVQMSEIQEGEREIKND